MVQKRIGSGATVGMMVRVSEDLRDRIKAAADANSRSMNSEIASALEEKYPSLIPYSAFERGVQAMLNEAGWSVESDRHARGFGIDMIAVKGLVAIAIECKAQMSLVNPELIERVATARKRLGSNAGVILGYGSTPDEAAAAAEKQDIFLIDVDATPDFPAVFAAFEPFAVAKPLHHAAPPPPTTDPSDESSE